MFSAPEAPSTEVPPNPVSLLTPGMVETKDSKFLPLGREEKTCLVKTPPREVLLTSMRGTWAVTTISSFIWPSFMETLTVRVSSKWSAMFSLVTVAKPSREKVTL